MCTALRRTRGLLPQTRRIAPVKWFTHLNAGQGEDAVGVWRTTASPSGISSWGPACYRRMRELERSRQRRKGHGAVDALLS